MTPPSPYRSLDDEARALLETMLAGLRRGILGVLDPDTGAPALSRIALQRSDSGAIEALLSGLSAHTAALARDGRAGLLLAPEEAAKGDPLTHPRLSLQVQATDLGPPEADRRAAWRDRDPRSAVWVDLPDFRLWRLTPTSGLLNAGFGRAYRVTPDDLAALTPPATRPAPGR